MVNSKKIVLMFCIIFIFKLIFLNLQICVHLYFCDSSVDIWMKFLKISG